MTDERAKVIIELINNKMTREQIVSFINQYGDPIEWEGYSDKEILQEVWRSDCEAGEETDGILSSMYKSI